LPDHIVIKDLAYLGRAGNAVIGFNKAALVLLADDVHAQFDAFIADEYSRAGN
jgi:hypothetical protein